MTERKNTPEDEARLIAEVTNAHRAFDPRELPFHPAWHDLDEDAREKAFDETVRVRAMEAALDPDGLSTTARAVLARIRGR
jgi:hypothetical protein